jgi:hypothetical protein
VSREATNNALFSWCGSTEPRFAASLFIVVAGVFAASCLIDKSKSKS